jgi:hypothetical protein
MREGNRLIAMNDPRALPLGEIWALLLAGETHRIRNAWRRSVRFRGAVDQP